jgi:hypothetical protein
MKRAILIGGALVLVVLIVLGGIVLVRALTL